MSLEVKEERIKKNNPQIHLLAANYCEQIRKIWNNSQDENEEEEIKILHDCIKFFAHTIKYLPECNNDVLNMCRFYMFLFKKDSVPLDIAVINRLVGISTTMLIERKDDEILRSICDVLQDILRVIPSDVLKKIILRYSKVLSYIFKKIYYVQTYYTQLCILDIFNYITKDLKDLRNATIKKNSLMVKASEEVLKTVYNTLDVINADDFINTSQKFLKFFNNNLFPKTCILSSDGRIMKINGISIKQPKLMVVNFNGRNLTVSFFVPRNYLVSMDEGTQTQSSIKDNEMIFVELECESVEAEKKVYKRTVYVEMKIDVQQAKICNHKHIQNIEIKNVTLQLIDNDFIVNRFMDVFYENFKTHDKMMNEDHASVIDDRESVMTFRTNMSLLNDTNISQPKQEKIKDAEIAKEVPKAIVKKENLEVKKENKVNVVPSESNLKSRPTRERPKVNYNVDIYDEDNMDNESALQGTITSYREYKSQQNKKTKEMMKDEDYILQPVEIITHTTTRKSKTTKFNPKIERKSMHYETDEDQDNQNTKKSRRGRKPKVVKNEEIKEQPIIVKKNRKVAEKDVQPNKQKVNVKPILKQIQIPKTNPFVSSKMDVTETDYVEPQKELVPKIQDVSEFSFTSGNSMLNDSETKPLNQLMTVKPTENKKVTFEGLTKPEIQKRKFEDTIGSAINRQDNKRTKVDEWLSNASDSFELFGSDDTELSAKNQNRTQVEMPKSAPSKNEENTKMDDDESDYSEGIYANDEHQHYSSSSQESIDLNAKKAPIKYNNRTFMSTSKNAKSQDMYDPVKVFEARASEHVKKLMERKKKFDENQNQNMLKYKKAVSARGRKYIDQVGKTKAQLKHLMHLQKRYQAAKAKLMEEVDEQEKLKANFKQTLKEYRKVQRIQIQAKKKEILDIKDEALRKNEELTQEIWRQYADVVKAKFLNSINNFYEI